jgi:hypothetical protein
MPFFIITLLFGLYALFTVDEQQFTTSPKIAAAVEELRAALPKAQADAATRQTVPTAGK